MGHGGFKIGKFAGKYVSWLTDFKLQEGIVCHGRLVYKYSKLVGGKKFV